MCGGEYGGDAATRPGDELYIDFTQSSNSDVLAALVGGAAVEQPEEMRVKALGALWNLARAAENKVAMWQRDEARAVLVGGAAVDQPEAVRVNAIIL